ncbi:DNA-3-methyladenine glycosylase I [Ilumatobacter coccineus]|uniref:DNA-3-methyladenine glycosylase I n=1 Tax=Ilumatobacter coccineus (strain NBRC 103263 / KCTC 29153 / YM16-304) TaxID=1313172 RepID=A0A6C7EDG7_ILUCY|nr:DNA-3-methyladenine glycosylase I [Ilumatobacter coccineus]BAN04511.1 DNA-3-methyladenine glycosylase I [Ilumatobacter coccineus YM16-304]
MSGAEPRRCGWPTGDALYLEYHDAEWGRPTTDADLLFEKICLEGFQSGLSWITILRKRENFRAAFADFDIERVARFGEPDVERLLGDAGIIRHRGKIEATINNAQRAIELIEAEGSLVDWIWSWAVTEPDRTDEGGIPATTPQSAALAKELKRRGWKFFGPTTAYAFMQSEGLTNDHEPDCFVHDACEAERVTFLANR